MNAKLENFELAFRAGTGGCRRTCKCGKVYYHGSASYDWEEGELAALDADKNAHSLDYTPGDIRFEGDEYVDACNCWHARAELIMGFIDAHAHQIAEYLTREKKRKQMEADHSPVVK